MSTSDGSTRKHSHYHKDVKRLNTIDVYRVLQLFGVTDPCTQHTIKKLLCAGQRGSKGLLQDLQEAVDTINRRIEMIHEDEALPVEFGQQNMIDPADVDIDSADDRPDREYRSIVAEQGEPACTHQRSQINSAHTP